MVKLLLKNLRNVFKQDPNNSNHINEIMDEMQVTIKKIDKNNDGEINFEEFSEFMDSLLKEL